MENNIKFAGFWIRHIAIFVDFLILFLIWILFWLILNLLWVQIDNTTTTWFIIQILTNLFWFLYFALFHFFLWKTPWKIAVWVKVVNHNFEKISMLQAFWRSFATILSALPLFLWYFWAWWDQKKRTFHDMLAKTYIIEEKAISVNWIIFWNVLIFILWILFFFFVVVVFYYLVSNPELLMQMQI